jgi:hypothetical protein
MGSIIPIGALGLGAWLIYSAIRGIPPLEAIRAALSGAPSPDTGAGSGGPPPVSGTTPTTTTPPPAAAGRTGSTPGTDPGEVVTPLGAAAYAGAVALAAPYRLGTSDPATVPIGYGGHRLAAPAAGAYTLAGRYFGRTIPVTDSTRTRAQQADCYRRKPDLCAPPGRSMHERGLAIDVDTSKVDPNAPALVYALTNAGWRRYDRAREPWHWSYGTIQ